MNLYLIGRTDNCDYDEYDGLVIVAKSEAAAIKATLIADPYKDYNFTAPYHYRGLNNRATLTCKFIGKASATLKENQIVISSFRAG